MARRDLSRTVIEGGRYRHNKFLRRKSHGRGRARERAWIDGVRVDVDIAEERALRERPKVNRMFYDKLAVPERWLRSRIGRPWDAVYSELLRMFDPRTIAGQHIVYDHMLHMVRRPGNDMRSRFVVEVDAHGILRAPRPEVARRKPSKRPSWVGDRWAAKHKRQWWWVGDRLVERCVQRDRCRYLHIERDGVPYHFTRGTLLALMTRTQIGRLLSLPPHQREVLLWTGYPASPEYARLARP